MFLSDNNQLVTEQFQLPSDNDQGDQQDQQVVEFQNIKLFLLYEKYSMLLNKIKTYMSLESDSEKIHVLSQLYKFIQIIQLYYNTLQYQQLVALLDSITNTFINLYQDIINKAGLEFDTTPIQPNSTEQSSDQPEGQPENQSEV